ncbi:hypothetical protein B0H16DRAFT_1750561 [Mycena metata]|uniref:Uncharacterized protein n=1 Tax=Mycena metata TaxID=1033252 RepID=A0AAD7GNA7_9AGAR|nr:hypothetical protein B0H16DRAFT_1750561 [Mycena metata]
MNVHSHAYPTATAFAHAPDAHPRPLASPTHASKDAAHRTRTLLRLRLSTRVHTHASGSVNTRTLASSCAPPVSSSPASSLHREVYFDPRSAIIACIILRFRGARFR